MGQTTPQMTLARTQPASARNAITLGNWSAGRRAVSGTGPSAPSRTSNSGRPYRNPTLKPSTISSPSPATKYTSSQRVTGTACCDAE